jgi:hypothetical protein
MKVPLNDNWTKLYVCTFEHLDVALTALKMCKKNNILVRKKTYASM